MESKPKIAAVAIGREFDLKRVGIIKSALDELLPERDVSTADAEARVEIKQHIVEAIIDLAEERYLAGLRKMAMDLMERDHSLTADEAVAHAEGNILEALLR